MESRQIQSNESQADNGRTVMQTVLNELYQINQIDYENKSTVNSVAKAAQGIGRERIG